MRKIPFNSAFTDITKKVTKIPKKEYLDSGTFPIVDQGDGKIAGYTNRCEGVFRNVPVVLFGDHTRVFKFIDFPFFAGADGTKILKANEGTDARFGYYSFVNNPLDALGYSRHFKMLKDRPFHTHDHTTQLRIAGVICKQPHHRYGFSSNTSFAKCPSIVLSSDLPLLFRSEMRDLKPAILSLNSSAVIGT